MIGNLIEVSFFEQKAQFLCRFAKINALCSKILSYKPSVCTDLAISSGKKYYEMHSAALSLDGSLASAAKG